MCLHVAQAGPIALYNTDTTGHAGQLVLINAELSTTRCVRVGGSSEVATRKLAFLHTAMRIAEANASIVAALTSMIAATEAEDGRAKATAVTAVAVEPDGQQAAPATNTTPRAIEELVALAFDTLRSEATEEHADNVASGLALNTTAEDTAEEIALFAAKSTDVHSSLMQWNAALFSQQAYGQMLDLGGVLNACTNSSSCEAAIDRLQDDVGFRGELLAASIRRRLWAKQKLVRFYCLPTCSASITRHTAANLADCAFCDNATRGFLGGARTHLELEGLNSRLSTLFTDSIEQASLPAMLASGRFGPPPGSSCGECATLRWVRLTLHRREHPSFFSRVERMEPGVFEVRMHNASRYSNVRLQSALAYLTPGLKGTSGAVELDLTKGTPSPLELLHYLRYCCA